jgi:RNA polymerase sigma-70 factor (ECF subfamily)
MNRDDEIELMRAAERGDAAAFSRLYHTHRDRVYGFVYRMTGAQAVAEDITHDTFLVLIEHPEKYRRERASLLTFLCAVARNNVMNYFRRNNYELKDSDNSSSNGGGSCDYAERKDEAARDPLSALLDRELAERVDASIAELPPLQREVLVLREFQELSYEEIATVTGAEVNVVRSRLHRARQSLAQRLAVYVSAGRRKYELR